MTYPDVDLFKEFTIYRVLEVECLENMCCSEKRTVLLGPTSAVFLLTNLLQHFLREREWGVYIYHPRYF